jgi:DUF438 domain-containing protein
MIDPDTMAAMLDSLKDPFLFADTSHTIRYMNPAAAAHYREGRALLGRSLFDCHNPQSQAMMREVFAALAAGETERRITEKPDQRIYMRAVRDPDGRLLGYYERYEWPWEETGGA